jgi:hypothetical protein
MAYQPTTPPVQSKSIDMRTIVASLDPKWRDPAEVYLFPNGRKFLQSQNPGDPAPTPPVIPDFAYEQPPVGAGNYYTSTADGTIYLRTT